jgi:hypothetical protein
VALRRAEKQSVYLAANRPELLGPKQNLGFPQLSFKRPGVTAAPDESHCGKRG